VGDPSLPCIVQFSVQIFFVEETEGEADLGIVRLGPSDKPCKVQWRTEDASAKAGHQYTAQSGEVVFEPGETHQHVKVPIVEDDVWHATTEFKAKLFHPHGCQLGNFLHTSRVKIIDNDQFPTNKFAEQVVGDEAKENIEKINSWSLLAEYCKLNWHQHGMGWRTVVILMFDQIPNLRLLLKIFMLEYMVDNVFNDEVPPDELIVMSTKRSEAYLIAFLLVSTMLLLHVWEKVKCRLDIKGRSTLFLRSNLIRKFMNYTEESRLTVDTARVQVAMLEDVDEMAGGYQAVLDLIRAFGKIAVLAGFTLYANPKGWWVAVLMPGFMMLWLTMRMTCMASDADSLPAKKAVVHLVNEITKNYELIVNYYQRPKINEMMLTRITALKDDELPERSYDVDDVNFPSILRAFFIGSFVSINAPLLLMPPEERPITIGTFVAILQVIESTTEAFDSFYEVLQTMKNAFDPVKEITLFMNLETDLKAWKEVNRLRRTRSKGARESLRSSIMEGKTAMKESYLEDQLPIEFKGVEYKFHKGVPVFEALSVTALQGQIVAVYGEHESGKTTLMHMIGHMKFPTAGTIFVPSHLRLLSVSQNYMIFETWTPWENLTFGINHHEIDVKRITYILEKLQMRRTLELIDDDLKKHSGDHVAVEVDDPEDSDEEMEEGAFNWVESLTFTEKAKMHFARALIANYEMTIMDCPLASFGTEASRILMEAVSEHVSNRGMGLPAESKHLRRPRTCFYTHEEEDDAVWADVSWVIKDKKIDVLRTTKEAS